MAKQEKIDRHLRCSFCGKSRDEVRKLIAGPTAVSYTHLDVYKRQYRESVNDGLAVLVFGVDLLNRPEYCLF